MTAPNVDRDEAYAWASFVAKHGEGQYKPRTLNAARALIELRADLAAKDAEIRRLEELIVDNRLGHDYNVEAIDAEARAILARRASEK